MSKRQIICFLILTTGVMLIAGCVPLKMQYTLAVLTDGEGTVSPTGGKYISGKTVTITATPKTDWKFDHWSGDAVGTEPTITVVMNADKTVTAHFIPSGRMVQWNFLVYMGADNNLEMYAIQDINEMEAVGSTENMNILVLVDRHPGYDGSNGDWSGTRLYRITKDLNHSGDIVSELIHDYGELDMSDPQVLENFLLTCHQSFPAERSVLTLWNHGDGLYPKDSERMGSRDWQGGTASSKGICWDDTTGMEPWSCLTTDEVAAALASVRQVTGKKVDIINMDACLMQTLEVAYEWRTETDYLVGSQAVVPAGGNYYATLLNVLQTNPAISTLDFTQAIVNDYFLYYSTHGDGNETYSALSLGAQFDSLISAFKEFATAMYETTDLDSAYIAWNAVTWFSVWEYVDLYDLTRELIANSQDAEVVNTATALQQALEGAIVSHKETIEYQGEAFGLSILLPTANEWQDYAEPNQYISFLLSKDTYWDDFILRFIEHTGTTTPGILLSAEMTWPDGNCDLGIWEPDDIQYWIDAGPSPNGTFSENMTDGGTEVWKINALYDAGLYTPLVYSHDYTGGVHFTMSFKGDTTSAVVNVEPGVWYAVSDFEIEYVDGMPQIQYIVREVSANR